MREICCEICGCLEWWGNLYPTNPFYEVSNIGRIRTTEARNRYPKGYIMFQHPNNSRDGRGDLRVMLSGGSRFVSNVVAEAFIGPRPLGKEVNHKDLNHVHNCYWNLEYTTHIENMDHAKKHKVKFGYAANRIGEDHPNSKLNWSIVCKIREKYSTGEYSQASLARRYNVSSPAIRQIILGNTWRESCVK